MQRPPDRIAERRVLAAQQMRAAARSTAGLAQLAAPRDGCARRGAANPGRIPGADHDVIVARATRRVR